GVSAESLRGGGAPEAIPPQTHEIRVFTTRPDTIFGATFMVLAPEHPLAAAFTTDDRRAEVQAYRKLVAAKDLVSRKVGEREKTGVFTGGDALNPATREKISVSVAAFVLRESGTGAIRAVPGHDERDFDFARRYSLPIVRVVAPRSSPDTSSRAERGTLPADPDLPLEAAYVENEQGVLVHSGQFDGLSVAEGKRAITAWLA